MPLYAFALLEQERTKPYYEQYAVKAKVEPFLNHTLTQQYQYIWSRVQNRCGDLLVVDNLPHPVCLSHSVDFLHRTVRDFLRDSYRTELEKLVKGEFNPLISLCNVCLALLKGAHIEEFRNPQSLKLIIGLTDELLYYAHKLERRFGDSEIPRLVPILDEIDKTNTTFARRGGGNKHWTHVRDLPPARGLDVYKEGGNCNFLALAVQACLTGYVCAKLEAKPRCMNKYGRPLLDYALPPLRITPIAMPYHSLRDEASIDMRMITLLLEHGADPNQPVYLYYKETVWGLFLISINETGPAKASTSLKESWCQVCRAMIRAGAQPDYRFIQCDPTVSSVLEYVFTTSEVAELQRDMAKKEREIEARQPDDSWWILDLANLIPWLR